LQAATITAKQYWFDQPIPATELRTEMGDGSFDSPWTGYDLSRKNYFRNIPTVILFAIFLYGFDGFYGFNVPSDE
jgi:hypothetical protein